MKYLFPSKSPNQSNSLVIKIILLFMITLNIEAQDLRCPNINAGADVTIDCSTELCVDLTATFLKTGQTNSYEVKTIPYAPPFPYTGLANQVSVGIDDIWSDIINLPFDFCFFEETYHQIQVGSNGVLRFDVDTVDLVNEWEITDDIPNNTNPALAEANIFGVGHDIDPSILYSNPEVAWAVKGEAPCRVFVISYANIANFICTELVSTSQIILYETTNEIEIYVKDKPICADWNDGNSIIGIQNNPGTLAFVPPGRNTSDGPWSATNEAWRFTPNGIPNYTVTWYNESGITLGNEPTLNVCPETTSVYTAEIAYNDCNGDAIKVRDDVQVTNNLHKAPNAGENGMVTLCADSISTIDLFHALGGTPDVGGTWTPALASGTGVFNPAIDAEGTYTYSVIDAPCPEDSANVVVSFSTPSHAGENGAIALCDTNDAIDLFTALGGTPDHGGVWSPPLASGTGVFDPAVDASGTYTYSITGMTPCQDDSAEILVSISNIPNAGENSAITLCSDSTSTIDLFDVLRGTPDAGGTWNPPLASGTGVFDPAADASGIYTYSITGITPCQGNNAEVLVSISSMPNAGENAVLSICETDSNIDLFTLLGRNPDSGGTWSPPLTSGTGVFDPAADASGTYTYSVIGTKPCQDDSAEVLVSVSKALSAGENSTIALCNTSDSLDLFTVLGGYPDSGGIWSPPLASGSGIFDPNLDVSGTYTYSITGISPCQNDSAEILVSLSNNPNAGENGTLSICESDSAIDLFTLLGSHPDNGGTWIPPLASGTGVFNPAVDPAGTYTYRIRGGAACQDDSANVLVTVFHAPNAGENRTLSICEFDNAIDLFTLLGGNPDSGGTWIPTLTSGSGVYNPILDPPGVYTYTINSTSTCPSDVAEISVNLNNAPSALQPNDLTRCDIDNDNVEIFDLERQSTFITADNVNYKVTYHINKIDADNGKNKLTPLYPNISSPQTIYARVEDVNTGCYNTTVKFDLILLNTAIANPDFYERCDDHLETDNNTSNDKTTFNLHSRNAFILGPTQSNIDYTVSYHLTQNDADNALNALPSHYENTINPQIVFARVENNKTACFDTAEIQLKVNPLPLFFLEDKYIVCVDNNGEILLPSPIINTGLNNRDYTFEWYLDNVLIAGETNSNITPSQIGAYSVVVTNKTTGCSSKRSTIVIESTPPILEIQQVSVTFVENNAVLAVVKNSENTSALYEFSLNDESWVSNDSNNHSYTFENVPAGEHLITVRDVNGCGETSASIILLDFIPYFTPNGDGIHDTWNIKGIENQSDAKLNIFDRYGKLLKQLKPNSPGWDGTFNGYVLPSSDYWFSLTYRDPNTNAQKNFKSHFTLKR